MFSSSIFEHNIKNLIRGLSQTFSIVLEFSKISFFVIRSLYIMHAILMPFTTKIIHTLIRLSPLVHTCLLLGYPLPHVRCVRIFFAN